MIKSRNFLPSFYDNDGPRAACSNLETPRNFPSFLKVRLYRSSNVQRRSHSAYLLSVRTKLDGALRSKPNNYCRLAPIIPRRALIMIESGTVSTLTRTHTHTRNSHRFAARRAAVLLRDCEAYGSLSGSKGKSHSFGYVGTKRRPDQPNATRAVKLARVAEFSSAALARSSVIIIC